MIYYTIIAMLICLTYLEWSGEDNNIFGSPSLEKYCYVFMATLLTLIAALRYKTGRDWSAYIMFYDNCLNIDDFAGWEPGYFFLNVIFKLFFNDYYVMQFVISVFCCWIMFNYFYKKSDKPIFVLLVYFLFNKFLTVQMAQQRQEIAMAILILGMHFVEQRSLSKWILTVIIAMQFHVSAIFAFPLYYTTGYVLSKKRAFILLASIVALELIGRPIVIWGLGLFLKTGLLPERLRFLISQYALSPVHGRLVEYGTGLGSIANYLLSLAVVALYNPDEDSYYMLNLLIALLFMAAGRNFEVLRRFSDYYLICGGGFIAYGLLNRLSLPKWASFGKHLDLFACMTLLSVFIMFKFATFYAGFNKIDMRGSTYKEVYSPYRSSLSRNIEF